MHHSWHVYLLSFFLFLCKKESSIPVRELSVRESRFTGPFAVCFTSMKGFRGFCALFGKVENQVWLQCSGFVLQSAPI